MNSQNLFVRKCPTFDFPLPKDSGDDFSEEGVGGEGKLEVAGVESGFEGEVVPEEERIGKFAVLMSAVGVFLYKYSS